MEYNEIKNCIAVVTMSLGIFFMLSKWLMDKIHMIIGIADTCMFVFVSIFIEHLSYWQFALQDVNGKMVGKTSHSFSLYYF